MPSKKDLQKLPHFEHHLNVFSSGFPGVLYKTTDCRQQKHSMKLEFRERRNNPHPQKKGWPISTIFKPSRKKHHYAITPSPPPTPPNLPVLQVIQIPNHDVTILGSCEEHISHATEALDKAIVSRQDVDAMPKNFHVPPVVGWGGLDGNHLDVEIRRITSWGW